MALENRVFGMIGSGSALGRVKHGKLEG